MDSDLVVPAEHIRALRNAAHSAFRATLSARASQVVSKVEASAVDVLLQSLLDTIKTDLRQYSRQLNSSICNVPNIPPEIWVDIWDRLALYDKVRATHVCHGWRQLALATPQIWSRLEISHRCRISDEDEGLPCNIGPGPGNGLQSAWPGAHGVDTFLQRSATLELDIEIEIDSPHCASTITQEFAALFAPHIGRIARLHFGADYRHTDFRPFLVALGSHFPVLRNLSASENWDRMVDEIDYDDEGVLSPSISFSAPRLESLMLINTSPRECQPLLSMVASEHLTRLSTHLRYRAYLCLLLYRCPRLCNIDLDLAYFYPGQMSILDGTELSTIGAGVYSICLRGVDLDQLDNGAELRDVLDWALDSRHVSVDIEIMGYNPSSPSQRDMFGRIARCLEDVYPASGTAARSSVQLELLRMFIRVSATVGPRRRTITSLFSHPDSSLWTHLDPARVSSFTLDTTSCRSRHSPIPPPTADRTKQGANAYFPALNDFTLRGQPPSNWPELPPRTSSKSK